MLAELSIDSFGEADKSRCRFPISDRQAKMEVEKLENKNIISINDSAIPLGVAIDQIKEAIEKGDLTQIIQVEITDEINNWYFQFDNGDLVEIKYREVDNDVSAAS